MSYPLLARGEDEMNGKKTIGIGLLLLLLAGLVLAAQEERPWSAEELDPSALEAEQSTADQARAALEEGDLKQAATLLGLAEIEDEDRTRWLAATIDRVAALRELAADAILLPDLPPESEAEQRLDAAREELKTLLGLEELPLPEDLTESRIQQLDVILDAAEAEVERSGAHLARLRELTTAVPALEGELERASRQLDTKEAAPGDTVAAYERDTLVIRVRRMRMRAESAPRASVMALDLLRVRREVARVRLERARDLVTRARKGLIKRRGAEADEWDERARAARKDAEEFSDEPIKWFLATVDAEIYTTRAELARDRRSLQELKTVLEAQMLTSLRLEDASERTRTKFEPRRGTSRRTPRLLLSNLKLIKDSRASLRRKLQPQLDRFADRFLDGRADLIDWIWEIDTPLDESPPGYRELMERIPDEERDAARRTYLEARVKLRGELRRRQEVLEEGVLAVDKLDGLYQVRRELLDDLEAFVITKIYWVRSDDPLSLATVRGAWVEIGHLVGLAGSPKLGADVSNALEQESWVIYLAGVTLLLLLVIEVRVWRRLKRVPEGRGEGRSASAAWRVIRVILLSALVPLFLLIACLVLSLFEFPEEVVIVYRTVLLALATALFVRRLSTALFGEGGVLAQGEGGLAEAAPQLLRFFRWASLIIVLLGIPFWITGAERFELHHLPHLLQTVAYVLSAAAVIYLFRRKGTFVQAITRQSGFWRRAFVVLSPLIALVLLGIVVMTVLGYRYGAILIFRNVLNTLVSGMLLALAYQLLTRVAKRAASRLRYFRMDGERSSESKERAEKHLAQFTRLVGVSVVVAGVVLLAVFWGMGGTLDRVLGSVHLTTVDAAAGLHLTLLDVIEAFAWVVLAHVFVRYLPGLLNVLIFSRLETMETGTRYVIGAVSKYLILLVAYSAALITLHFSFSSVGWLLAAASVGLGFGLQEIVSNFVSGLILFIERPIRVGDMVSVSNTLGTVERIDIRATKILNLDRQVIIIPNRKFISEDVVNWTHNDLLIRSAIDVGVAYGSDVPKVRRILREVVEAEKRVKRDPEPKILFMDFGNSSLDFRVYFHTLVEDRIDAASDVRNEIDRRFREEGVVIPFPQRDLHVKTPGGQDLLDAFRGAPPKPDDLSGFEDSGSEGQN